MFCEEAGLSLGRRFAWRPRDAFEALRFSLLRDTGIRLLSGPFLDVAASADTRLGLRRSFSIVLNYLNYLKTWRFSYLQHTEIWAPRGLAICKGSWESGLDWSCNSLESFRKYRDAVGELEKL